MLYELIEEKTWTVVFVGTEAECEAFTENPDHNEIYVLREVNHDKVKHNNSHVQHGTVH